MNKSRQALSYFVLFLLLFGCKNSSENFTLGDELVDIKSNIIVNDTTTVRASTIRSDSIPTSGVSTMLVGQYFDGTLGNIAASSYFRVAVGSFSKISTDPLSTTVCDSLSLILNASHYSYGDTLLPYTIEVHRISENMENNLSLSSYGYRYSNSKVNYDPEILGQATFVPRPKIISRISIRLTKSIQDNLFNLITNQLINVNDATQKQADFVNNFKGVALLPPTNLKSSSVLGYKADNTSLYLLFYLNTNGAKDTMAFALTNTNLLYTRIDDLLTYNNPTNPLDILKKSEIKVPSYKTGNVTYCQAGTGFMTKFEFPYLKNSLLSDKHIRIMKAELLLYPLKGSYQKIPLPSKVQLYATDNVNHKGSVINDTTKSQLYIDNLYHEETSYAIDITSYVRSMIQANTDEIPSMIVSFADYKNWTTLDRVIFSDGLLQVKSTRLKITYWRY